MFYNVQKHHENIHECFTMFTPILETFDEILKCFETF